MTAITEQDVERVARAIWDTREAAKPPFSRHIAPFDRLLKDAREYPDMGTGPSIMAVLADARAALEAFLAGRQEAGPVAEIVALYGDPVAFAEHGLEMLADVQKLPIGAKLYLHPSPARREAMEEAAGIAENQAFEWVNHEAETLYGQAYQHGCRDAAQAIRAAAGEKKA